MCAGLESSRVGFTGDATRDFETATGAWQFFVDAVNASGAAQPDVSVPLQFGAGVISGWCVRFDFKDTLFLTRGTFRDMRGIYLAYSSTADRLYGAFDCFGIWCVCLFVVCCVSDKKSVNQAAMLMATVILVARVASV